MIILFGTRTNKKNLGQFPSYCRRCNRTTVHSVRDQKNWFTLFFIPVIPLSGTITYGRCNICGQESVLNKNLLSQSGATALGAATAGSFPQTPMSSAPLQTASAAPAQLGAAVAAPTPAQPGSAIASSGVYQKYLSKGFTPLMLTDTSALLKNQDPINVLVLIFLILACWPAAIVYGVARKKYQVQLSLGADGRVQETGDTSDKFDRGVLGTRWKRDLGLGILFTVYIGLAILLFIITMAIGPGTSFPSWSEFIITFGVIYSIAAIPAAIAAILFFVRSKKHKDELAALGSPMQGFSSVQSPA